MESARGRWVPFHQLPAALAARVSDSILAMEANRSDKCNPKRIFNDRVQHRINNVKDRTKSELREAQLPEDHIDDPPPDPAAGAAPAQDVAGSVAHAAAGMSLSREAAEASTDEFEDMLFFLF